MFALNVGLFIYEVYPQSLMSLLIYDIYPQSLLRQIQQLGSGNEFLSHSFRGGRESSDAEAEFFIRIIIIHLSSKHESLDNFSQPPERVSVLRM